MIQGFWKVFFLNHHNFFIRLEDELKILREIYSQHMKISEETLEKSYKNKVQIYEITDFSAFFWFF